MIALLKELSLPTASIIFLLFSLAVLRELFFLLRSYRVKAADLVIEKELKDLDARIEEFYLPLRERFKLTECIFQTTSKWQENDRYKNSELGIQSANPGALRDIVVRKIFLPLNTEIQQIIFDKLHWKHPADDTNYELILQHFIFWKALESSKLDGSIENYEASHFLSFPAEEVGKQLKMSGYLLDERDRMRTEIKNFREISREKRREHES